MKIFKPNPKAQSAKKVAGSGGYRIVSFPREFERGIFGNIDKRFYLILSATLFSVYSVVITLANVTYSDEELASLLKEKYIQKIYDAEFEIPEPVEEEVAAEGLGEEEVEEKKEEDVRAKENVREEAAGTSAAERRAQQREAARNRASARSEMQQQVAGTGILAELSAGGSGGSGDAVYDVLGETGNSGLGNLDDVLSGVGGLQSASSSNRRSSLGERAGAGGRSGRAGIDDLISTGTGQSASVNINRSANFAIKGVEGSLSGKGTKSTARSQDAIGRVVGRHADAVESCYKRESRINPNLKGSVTAQFTIRTDGRVAGVKIVDSSLHNRNVENCMTKRIRSWRFDKIDRKEGDVTARYKWVFSN